MVASAAACGFDYRFRRVAFAARLAVSTAAPFRYAELCRTEPSQHDGRHDAPHQLCAQQEKASNHHCNDRTSNAHAAVTRTSEWSHTRQRCSPVRLWPLHCTALPCGIGRRIAQGVPHVSVLQREFRVRGHRVGGVETLAVVGACRASVSALQHQSLPNRAMCWMPLTCGMQCITALLQQCIVTRSCGD
jgi:hypothetical protein